MVLQLEKQKLLQGLVRAKETRALLSVRVVSASVLAAVAKMWMAILKPKFTVHAWHS